RRFRRSHLSAADGVVAHKSRFGVNDHPGRSDKEASRHFLNVASTPPHEEGNKPIHRVPPFVSTFFGRSRSLSVWVSETFGDSAVGRNPTGIEWAAGSVDVDHERRMVRRYRLPLTCLTIDLGPDNA